MSAGRQPTNPPRFVLRTSVIDDTTVAVAVAGEVNATTAGQFGAVLRGVLGKPGLTRIVLDFAALRFLDAHSVTVLQAAHRTAGRRGIVLAVTNCRGPVRRALETVDLYRHLAPGDDAMGLE
ncbi:STAS domain-containing protein [Planosporangium thailandense]|uniref:STAS domain-containing protein n=1 Tax=Planosporangium thailandense TaxID=765197 RepID=A0ABX0XUZ1_9ACTN|nr:STAS domain-containing protein [Planosporangium thailandense]NJC69147.1 STAS domain-containing protein [Planosporangium thailandense]